MSSSTIRTTIRPGQRTVERLAARRQARAAAFEKNVEDLAAQRTEELQARGVDGAERLAPLKARLEASSPDAGRRELTKARDLLAEAEDGGSLEAAAEAIDRLETRSTERWADREERKLLLEELSERTRVRIDPKSTTVQDDGRITASASIPGRGASPISIAGSQAGGGEGSVVFWHVSRSSIRGRPGKDECDVQREAIEQVAQEFGARMSIEPEGEQEQPAQPSHVTRRAR